MSGREEVVECRLCGLLLFEPHTALVEVTQSCTVIRKAVFYDLHALCADDWAYGEMKRLRAVFRNQPELEFSSKVEVMLTSSGQHATEQLERETPPERILGVLEAGTVHGSSALKAGDCSDGRPLRVVASGGA